MVKMPELSPELERLLSEYKDTFVYEYVGKIKLDNRPGGSHHEWHIGRITEPLVLLTKSIYPHQALQFLLYTFPCYNPSRQQKNISATVLMQQVDKILGVQKSGEVVDPYIDNNRPDVDEDESEDDPQSSLFMDDGDVFADKGNPDISDEENEEHKTQANELLQIELDGGLSLNGHHALDEDVEARINEASRQDGIEQEQFNDIEKTEAKLIKLEETGADQNTTAKLKSELDEQETNFNKPDDIIDIEIEDDLKPAGEKESSSFEHRLTFEEGFSISDNDVRFGGMVSKKTREEYKEELPKQEKELVKLQKRLEKETANRTLIKEKAFDLILNGTQKDIASSERKIKKSNKKIKQLEIDIKNKKHTLSILKSPRIDDKDHHSSTEKMRDTARTYIRRALSDIAGLGDEGQWLANYIDLRLDTGDPVAYQPKKGDNLWTTSI